MLSYCSSYYLANEPTEDYFFDDNKVIIKFIDENKFEMFKYHSSEEVLELIKTMAEYLIKRSNLKFEEE